MSSIVGAVVNNPARTALNLGAQQPAQLITAHSKPANSQFLSLPLPQSIKNDLNNLSTALAQENMHAAQTAFTNLIADMKGHYRSENNNSSTISLLG